MSNGKDMIIQLIVRLMKNILYKNESIFSHTIWTIWRRGDINVKVDLSNYRRKANLKNAADFDTSSFVKKTEIASLKSNVDKLDVDKLKNVPIDLSNFKSKVEKFDIGKLKTTLVVLSKLSNIVKNDVVKKDVYNAKIKNIEYKILDITNLATETTLNT